MLEKAGHDGVGRAGGADGIGVIPHPRDTPAPSQSPEQTEEASAEPELPGHRTRLPRLRGWWNRRPSRELRRRVPDPQQIRTWALAHRALLVAITTTAALTTSDTSFAGMITERTPAPNHAQRVAVAYPPQLQHTPPSARRLLNAIANGERLREQAVVAAAARATLERAKAEAAAAVAGEPQPWIAGAAPIVPGSPIIPGSILPGISGFVLPARGVFTSGFGSRWGTFHQGIDIAGPIGTPIYAVATGTVIDAGPAQGFGLWVRIRHDDGSITVYGHMYDFFVSVGERVPAGMQIARMGNRGDSTGPHLHFEVIAGGRHVDPLHWLALRGLRFE
ncbi:M23 family metallopeptidase [Nocardia sp. CNY236]|uniref:M23 family metallopeptidase n=1 Tax=Nocardia sp. CNY236 TaxID=1169152 RepID=UPI00048D97D3|nr:M23 family metallopeptidase [Nocardia sp. CNY236]